MCTIVRFPAVKRMLTLQELEHSPIIEHWPKLDVASQVTKRKPFSFHASYTFHTHGLVDIENPLNRPQLEVNELELDDLCIVFAPSFDFDIAEGPRSSFLFKLLRR